MREKSDSVGRLMRIKNAEVCERLYVYIENNPDRCDVTFLVGPTKEIVKTLRAVLEVSSPVFTKLFENVWDPILAKPEADDDGEPVRGIALPDLDPRAFKIFHKLLLTDVSVEALAAYKMNPELLLNVMEVARKFAIYKVQHNLNALAEQTLFSNLTGFIQSKDFLYLSQKNVCTILSRDEISMDEADIFDIACKWSEVQCARAGLAINAENVREMLGDCLYQIRFPIMSYKDFGKIMRTSNILTPEEQIKIFKYLSLDDSELVNYSVAELGFITKARSMLFGPTVSLLKLFSAGKQPPFICDGQTCVNYIQVDEKVSVTALGFLGPIEYDALYYCEIEIMRYNSNYSSFSCAKVERRVFAKHSQIFYIRFDEPVTIEATHTNESIWNDYYGLRFSLKGPNTRSLELGVDGVRKSSHRFRAEADSVGFYCQWSYSPLVELQFSKFC